MTKTAAVGTTPAPSTALVRHDRWRIRRLVLAGALALTGVAPVLAMATPSGVPTPGHVQVRSGDTLSSLAARLQVEGGWQALYQANRNVIGPDPARLNPGAVLVVPTHTSTTRTETASRYTVQPGDSLTVIAARLHFSGGAAALYALNRASIGASADRLTVGQELAVRSTPAEIRRFAPIHLGPALAIADTVAGPPAQPIPDSKVLARKSNAGRHQLELAGVAGSAAILALLGLGLSRRQRRPVPPDELGPIGVVTGTRTPRRRLALPARVPDQRAAVEQLEASAREEDSTVQLRGGAQGVKGDVS